ncbi:MAG: hypothetical protein GQ576_00310 [Methanococcoides sp.]|nr:hypothetical protein [Methanococcoides sp.]
MAEAEEGVVADKKYQCLQNFNQLNLLFDKNRYSYNETKCFRRLRCSAFWQSSNLHTDGC